MKLKKLSLYASSAILGAAMLVGCGSDSSSSTSSTTTSSVNGQGLAAYIKGGSAFVDCNKNSIQDSGELNATTSATGEFSISGIPASCSDYQIVITGGVNSETNASIPYPTVAPKGFTKVSPLTTLMADLNETQQTEFLTNLGVTKDELNKIDYNTNADNNATQAKVAKIASFKTFVETTLASLNATDSTNVADIAKSIVEAVKDVNLSNTSLDDNTTFGNLQTALANKVQAKGFEIATLNSNLNNVKNVIKTIAESTTIDKNVSKAVQDAEQANKDIVEKANKAAKSFLVVSGNKVNVLGEEVIVANGTFPTITKKDSEINLGTSSIFDVSFTIDTTNFESNISKNVKVAVMVEAAGEDKRELKAYIDRATFTKNENNVSSVTIPADAILYAKGIKSSGAPLETKVTNKTTNTFQEQSAGLISFNLKDVFDRLNSQISTELTTISKVGTYNVKAVIAGVDINETKKGESVMYDESVTILGSGISGTVMVTADSTTDNNTTTPDNNTTTPDNNTTTPDNNTTTGLTDNFASYPAAVDNNGNAVSATVNTNLTAKVFSDTNKTGTSNSTIAFFGTIDGTNTGAALKLNGDYANTAKFVIKVYDSNNKLVAISQEIPYNATAINFGALTTSK